MNNTSAEQQLLARYRRYLDKPHTDPWNWAIVIGVLVVFLAPLGVAWWMLP